MCEIYGGSFLGYLHKVLQKKYLDEPSALASRLAMTQNDFRDLLRIRLACLDFMEQALLYLILREFTNSVYESYICYPFGG